VQVSRALAQSAWSELSVPLMVTTRRRVLTPLRVWVTVRGPSVLTCRVAAQSTRARVASMLTWATFVAVILGQVTAAALIDRFGWLGVRATGFGVSRAVAIALLLVSLVLLARE